LRAPKCDSNRDEAKSTGSDISVSPSPFAKNTLAYLTAAFRVVGRCVTITHFVTGLSVGMTHKVEMWFLSSHFLRK